jgi:hypothetical protein
MATEIELKSTSKNTVDVLGLDDINADVGLDDINVDLKLELPQPFKTDAVNTVTVNPLKTDSSVTVDLKPAVVDLCLTLNIGKLPNVCIKQPYHHHIGFTMYGMKVWGFSFSGEQETVIEEHHPQPRVALGARPAPWSAPRPTPRAAPQSPVRETGGLRIRLGG